MEDLGRNKRITGLRPTDWSDEPETVSAPMPRADRQAWDPNFQGDLPFDEERAERVADEPRPMRHAAVTPAGAQAARTVDENLEHEAHPTPVPRHAAAPGQTRAPFVREPVPHKTQPAVNLMDEDADEERIDYTHESDFTTRRGSMLSGGGYRRSRSDEKRFKEGLKYGQYLEVPKGRRDLFASRAQQRNRTLALFALTAAAVAAVAWVLVALFTH